MSHTQRIKGLPNLKIEQVRRQQGIEVWAKPYYRPNCYHCDHDDLKIKATYKRTVKHTRQGNQVMTLHLRVPKYYCCRCKHYFRHRFTGIKPRYRASETYRLEVFEAHHGGISQSKIARTHSLSPATVERWYKDHLAQ